jgi:hypothetical protein
MQNKKRSPFCKFCNLSSLKYRRHMRVTPAHRSENKTSKYKVKAWHSINDFIEAYYNEPTCPSQSLQDQTVLGDKPSA